VGLAPRVSLIDEPSNVQSASKSSDVQESLPYIPTPTMTQKEVRDELAIA
jgi:hypothetical protein